MRLSAGSSRVLALSVLIALTNVYVFASGAVVSSSKGANEAGTSKMLLGKLVTTSNRPILVNGGAAITGTVILSGALLATPASSFATVQVENVGTVNIAPNSLVTLTFDANNMTVKVASGDATVVTAAGVKGVVLDAAGNPVVPGVPKAPASANNALYWGVAGVAVGGAALIWAIIAHNRANDARDSANAANASAASLAAQLAALRTCLAGQTTSPIKLCTSF